MAQENILPRRIDEIRKALTLELYNCALTVALTLPDICGRVAYPSESNGRRYKKWFRKYARPLFINTALSIPDNETTYFTCFTEEECWALRCGVLHAGNYKTEGINLSTIRLHVHFRKGENYSHFVRMDEYADWDVVSICEKLCLAAEQYYLGACDKSVFDLDEVRIENW